MMWLVTLGLLLMILNSVLLSASAADVPPSPPSADSKKAAQKPHIIFIMADDLGYNDVSYHGSEIFTPNIDGLALSGVRLENYYVAPSCGPTRAQFLSGRYNIHTGTQHGNFFPCKPYGLPLKYPTLSSELKNLGYSTHMIGKWHLGYHTVDYLPTRRGFDTFRGMLTGNGDHFTHKKKYGRQEALDFYEGEEPFPAASGYYSTHLYTRRAENIIRAHNNMTDAPLFMWLSYQAPHTPLQAPEEYEKQFSFIPEESRKTYAAMVSALDEGVGKVLTALVETGLYENSVVIFSTDNGGQQEKGASNYPLKGNKDTLFEGGIRGVGFISGPLIKRPGEVSDQLIHITDWMPTFIHIAGGNTSHIELDGINQWNTLTTGEPTKREEILLNIDEKTTTKHKDSQSTQFDTRIQAGIRWRDWKLLTGHPGYPLWVPAPQVDYSLYALTANLITNKGAVVGEETLFLYNIRIDPYERFNLVNVRPDIAMDLLNKLEAYRNSSLPPLDPKNDLRCNPRLRGDVWGPYLPSRVNPFDFKTTTPSRESETTLTEFPVTTEADLGDEGGEAPAPLNGPTTPTFIEVSADESSLDPSGIIEIDLTGK